MYNGEERTSAPTGMGSNHFNMVFRGATDQREKVLNHLQRLVEVPSVFGHFQALGHFRETHGVTRTVLYPHFVH